MIIKDLQNTTWQFAEKICYPAAATVTLTYNLNFIVDNINYTTITFSGNGRTGNMVYSGPTETITAFNYATLSWSDDKYRTLTIVDGTDIMVPMLISFFNLCAKNISSSSTGEDEVIATISYDDEVLASLTDNQSVIINCDNVVMEDKITITPPPKQSISIRPESADWPYIALKSPHDFTLASLQWEENMLGGGGGPDGGWDDWYTVTPMKTWDGTIEYSTDNVDWLEWDGETTLSSINGQLYLRGIGNTYITGAEDYAGISLAWQQWEIEGANVRCLGNLENLLDYQVVANGEHPYMEYGCFYYMFSNCDAIVSAFDILADTIPDSACYGMYEYCYNLTQPGHLMPTEVGYESYCRMFIGCALEELPALPATQLNSYVYNYMFGGGGYYDENDNWIETSGVQLSFTKSEEFPYTFRVPTFGVGELPEEMYGNWDYPTVEMFSNNNDPNIKTPLINTTYYANIPTYGVEKLQKKKVLENGIVLPDPGYEGLSEVEVNVHIPTIDKLTDPIVTNGTYKATDFELEGINEFTVKVPIPDNVDDVWGVLDGQLQQGKLAYGETVSTGDFVELINGFTFATFANDITGDVYGGKVNNDIYAVYYKTNKGLKLRAINLSTSPAMIGPECMVTTQNCSEFEASINNSEYCGLTYAYTSGAYHYINAYIYHLDLNTLEWSQAATVFSSSGLTFYPWDPTVIAVDNQNFIFGSTFEGLSNYGVNLYHVHVDRQGTIAQKSTSYTTGTNKPKMHYSIISNDCVISMFYYGGISRYHTITIDPTQASVPSVGAIVQANNAYIYNVCVLDPDDLNYTLYCESATLRTIGGLSIELPDASEVGMVALSNRSALLLGKTAMHVAEITTIDGVDNLVLYEQPLDKSFTYVASKVIFNSASALAAPVYEAGLGNIYSIILNNGVYSIDEGAFLMLKRAAVPVASLGIAMNGGTSGETITVMYPRMPYTITWDVANAKPVPAARQLFWDNSFETTLVLPETFFPNGLSVDGSNYTWDETSRSLVLYEPTSNITVNLIVIQKFNIEYELNGGTLADPLDEYIVGENTILPTPTKENDVFLGWHLLPTFDDEPITTIESTQTGHLKFYAAWQSMVHNFTFNVPSEFTTQTEITSMLDGQTKVITYQMPDASYSPICTVTNVQVAEAIDLTNATYTLTFTNPTPGDIEVTITYTINKVPTPVIDVTDDILTVTDDSNVATGFTVYIDNEAVQDLGDVANSIEDKGEKI